MRSRPACLRAGLVAGLAAGIGLAVLSPPVSAGPAAGESLALPAGTDWDSSRSDMAIGDDGTLAWVSRLRVDGRSDVVVRMRPPGSATWSAPVPLDAPGADVGAGPVVDVDGLGRAVVAWTELGAGKDVVVVRRVSGAGSPGARLQLGAGADGSAPDGGGPLALDTSSSGATVVGFSDRAAGLPAAVTVSPEGSLAPWRHLQAAGSPAGVASLDVAVDEQHRTWATWTTGSAGSAGLPHVARLAGDRWVSRLLPGGSSPEVQLESGHDATALAWTGDGDGDGARDDVLTLTFDAAAAPVDVPAGWDPVAAGLSRTLLDLSSPLLTLHRSQAWLATSAVSTSAAGRRVEVRTSGSAGGWGPPVTVPSPGDRHALAAGWLVTGDPVVPTLAVAVLKPGGSTASRLDLVSPDDEGAWSVQRVVTPRVAVHSVRVEDSGAAHGAVADGFVVVTDDTEEPDSSRLLRLAGVPAPPVTTPAPLPAWSLGTARLTWTTDLPASLTELRTRRAAVAGGFDAGTTDARSAPPHDVDLAPGQTGCVAARSRAGSGDYGPWSAERCTARPADDRHLTRSGAWTRRTGEAFYGGTASTATRRGAALSLAVTGARRLALVASTCPRCGKVTVSLGGRRPAAVSLARPVANRRVLPVASFASPRSGKVVVRVATSGRKVVVDGLGVSKR